MEFAEYLAEVMRQYRVHHKSMRLGQTAVNYLHAVRPDLSERLPGHVVDPFYDDAKFGDYCKWLLEEWE